MASKQDTLTQIGEEWRRFLEVAKGFSQEDQALLGAVGQWSVRDVLIHTTAWDLDLVKVVRKHRETGEESHFGTDEEVDRLNETQVEEKRGLTPTQTWDYLDRCHEELVRKIGAIPDGAYAPGTYTGQWIATDSWGHYRSHREDLERWKVSRNY